MTKKKSYIYLYEEDEVPEDFTEDLKMVKVEGEVPRGFWDWFGEKVRLATGKEYELLSKVDIREWEGG